MLVFDRRCKECGRFMTRDYIFGKRPYPHGLFYKCNKCDLSIQDKSYHRRYRRDTQPEQLNAHCTAFVVLKKGLGTYDKIYRMRVLAVEERLNDPEVNILT